ncbi:ABC transporter substrate-binding protein [Paenibacillus glufosinatiresistens]|uniref:ABC transporter substrate-binding protein n=1 Tax=Paenibacillus glufosinatiresistens TaxID=3070657 RepID=UPI00286E5E97|nr:ABC transporter substrate-binding protein [Paenibacillus sp. YX.27]
MARKPYSSWLAAILALSLILAGCQRSETGKEAAQREKVASPSAASSGIGGEITFISNRPDLVENGFYNRYVDQFKKKYPAVTDVHVTSLNDYATDIRVKILSNHYGDVLILPLDMDKSNLGDYFEPLDDLGLGENLYFNNNNAYEGKTYGITIGVSAVGIIYNKKAFKTAGITSVPTNREQFYAACEKLKQAGITPVHLSFSSGWTLTNWGGSMSPILTGDESRLQYMTGTDRPFREDAEIGKAYGVIRTIVQKGYAESDLFGDTWEQSKSEIAKGNEAMYYLGNWAIAQVLEKTDTGVKSEDIGFMPLPVSETGTPNAYLNPDYSLGVNKNSPNKAAAKAWIKFLIEESDMADQLGYIPTLKTRESSIPQIKEFLSYHPKMLSAVKTDELFSRISSAAEIQLDDSSLIREIALSSDIEAEYAKLNDKWQKARREVIGKDR